MTAIRHLPVRGMRRTDAARYIGVFPPGLHCIFLLCRNKGLGGTLHAFGAARYTSTPLSLG